MRRVLITGGGSGIGRAAAHAFAAAGDSVTIAGRRMEALQETDGDRGMTCRIADVGDEASVRALFDQPFDVVVANAGVGKASKVVNTSLDQWNEILAITLTGVFLTFREALAGMQPGGRLIAVSSIAGLKGAANIAAYSAAKHGVMGLVKSLAMEVAKQGITCNAVCPGYVDTPMAAGAQDAIQNRFGLSGEAARSQLVAGNPVGRIITPGEVAAAILYLASSDAAMVNGHGLVLSGGEV